MNHHLVLFVPLMLLVATADSLDVQVRLDSPVMIGSKLNINVRIKDPVFPYYYYYEFMDNVEPLNTYQTKYDSAETSMTIEYNNNKIVPGQFFLNLKISNAFGHTKGWLIYEQDIAFTLTDHVPGKLEINQVHNDSDYVVTNLNMTALAKIHDPNNFLSQYVLSYSWFVDKLDVPVKDKLLNYIFTKPTNQYVSVIVEAKNGSHTYYGNYSRLVMPRDPVKIADIKGKRFIEYGELLEITIHVNGSKPFLYCWSFHRSCKPRIPMQEDFVQITQFMRSVGEYTLLFTVSNKVSFEEKLYTVKVLDVVKKETFAFLIVPTIFVILVILVLLILVMFVLRERRNYLIEVANFDLILNDEDLTQRTLFERAAQEFCSSRPNRTHLNPVEVAE